MNDAIWYGRFERVMNKPNGEPYKQPKYACVRMWGKYAPMDMLRSKRGQVEVSLLVSKDSGSKDGTSTPELKLQTTIGLNLTGLKNYLVKGRLSEYNWGNPFMEEFYPKDKKEKAPNPDKPKRKKKRNPFFPDYIEDGFLFRFIFEGSSNIPSGFDMLIVPNVGTLIGNCVAALQRGEYDSFIDEVNLQLEKNG